MENSNGVNGSNGNGKKREQTAARIIAALYETKGLLNLTAQKTGIGYRTVCRYVAEYPTVKEAVREAKESMIDIAEAKLYGAITKGEPWAICFYLKTQAKSRGYVEKVEQESKIDITTLGQSIKQKHIALPADTVKQSIDILAKAGVITISSN